ncbi:hypothetical protein NFI96_027339, partial [Prochilodus magdalenae]
MTCGLPLTMSPVPLAIHPQPMVQSTSPLLWAMPSPGTSLDRPGLAGPPCLACPPSLCSDTTPLLVAFGKLKQRLVQPARPGNFIDELDTLLSLFPVDGSPLLLLGDFNLPSDKLQSSCLQPLLSSFDLTLNPSPPTHRGGNTLDLTRTSFKPAHSMETALIAVTERLHAATSARLSSVLILLDLSAAFDMVNHKILLSVLTDLGITGTAWKWFESYLEDCHYQVTWNGSTSAPCRLSTGVPQGSVLGPLLFSLYTLSLGEVITSHSFSYHCYADDTQLRLSFPSSDTQVCSRISACLTDISSWMTAHHLKLKPSKTELLFIPSTTGPHCDLAFSLGNSTEDARSLGVILDGQLSFSAHIANLTRSCRFLLYNIRRIRPFLSQEATQLPVHCPVSGHFKARLLQLAPGWSSSAGHQALAT